MTPLRPLGDQPPSAGTGPEGVSLAFAIYIEHADNYWCLLLRGKTRYFRVTSAYASGEEAGRDIDIEHAPAVGRRLERQVLDVTGIPTPNLTAVEPLKLLVAPDQARCRALSLALQPGTGRSTPAQRFTSGSLLVPPGQP